VQSIVNNHFRQVASEAVPLLIILVGAALVSFSLGPYQCYDSHLEFEAASNVLKMGVPYLSGFGAVIDQPPLGFYTDAAFLSVVGQSENTGVIVVTLFGLATTALMYFLGRELYGKPASLVAAALYGLNPWQLALSRTFLIDTECLFFSMLTLLLGVLAIRKCSGKLALATGLAFAAALMTKFYAAFILIPLLLFYIYSHPKKPQLILRQIAAFTLPVLICATLWYQVALGKPILAIFVHNDFADVIPASAGVVASPYFVLNFLRDYGLGVYLAAAVVFSLLLLPLFGKYFKAKAADIACMAAAGVIVSANTVLGAGLNLNVPYFSALKYDLQALPYLVLLAAALVAKCLSLLKAAKPSSQSKKLLFTIVAAVGLLLIAASLLSSMGTVTWVSQSDYIQYRVEPQVDYGYALLNPTPLLPDSPLMCLQWAGFAAVTCGLLLAVAWRFGWLSKLHRIIEA
jgi:4-amino-4-deoxy-L-arabinose transferase-like glycosyltransferase